MYVLGDGHDSDTVSDLRALVESLQTQLEESRRWNASLQARLSHPQQRPGTVGGSNGSSHSGGTNGHAGGDSEQMGGGNDQRGGAVGQVGGASDQMGGANGQMGGAYGQEGGANGHRDNGVDAVDWHSTNGSSNRPTPNERTGGVGGSAYDHQCVGNDTLEHPSYLPSFIGLPGGSLPDDDTIAHMSKGKTILVIDAGIPVSTKLHKLPALFE